MLIDGPPHLDYRCIVYKQPGRYSIVYKKYNMDVYLQLFKDVAYTVYTTY
jgi:hypothetical protein